MKNILLFVALTVGMFASVNAQFVNGKPVSELKNDYKYLEVLAIPPKPIKTEVHQVQILFGQVETNKEIKKAILYKDKLGQEPMIFINDVSVLNFFYDNGYRLHTTDSNNMARYILERIDDPPLD